MKTVPSTSPVPKSKPKRSSTAFDWLHVTAIGFACLFGGGMLFSGQAQASPPVIEIIQPAVLERAEPAPVAEPFVERVTETGEIIGRAMSEGFDR